ncbi:MAG TPA: glycosyltransferase family 4 protein [Methyloceanibacter sp.]|jgi:glycosyltransferase involved in cell wall biosynthesis|nr:glycosyltransferase family 4 protein [Methyloceanibacter sp.]
MGEVTILQVVPRLDTGGSEQATVEIAEALGRAGAKALVATAGGRLATAVTQAGGEIVKLPAASKNPFTILANATRLKRLIKERDIDLVHARSRAPAWSAYLAARATGRPFVTTYHGAYGTTLGLFKGLYNSVMGRGDRVIANSRYTASLIAARHHLSQSRIRPIYRGIDEASFDPLVVPPGLVAKLRERWGVPPGTKIVLQAARLTGLKGHRQTIEAAAALAREGALENALIVFAGDAPGKDAYRQELIGLIARSGVEDKVRLVGHCHDMPAAFLAAHVAIMPSLVPETFGRTSIEAQAMGCPVILSDIGALPETIVSPEQDKARFTGWLVPPADATALAKAIRAALALTPEERAAIAARANARASREFALTQMQVKTLAVYDELLGTHLAEAFAHPPLLAAVPLDDGA